MSEALQLQFKEMQAEISRCTLESERTVLEKREMIEKMETELAGILEKVENRLAEARGRHNVEMIEQVCWVFARQCF